MSTLRRHEVHPVVHVSARVAAMVFALHFGVARLASAQTTTLDQLAPEKRASIAVETDILSYFLSGYSIMANVSLPNKFQAAFGIGSYDVPDFIVEGDPNFDVAQWQARVTSVQVLRVTYRYRGPRKSGPALGGVILNQHWQLESLPLDGDTTFRELRAGLTGGYYFHIGNNFYIYPTAAITYNNVYSGETSVASTNFETDTFSPNASLHVGWAW